MKENNKLNRTVELNTYVEKDVKKEEKNDERHSKDNTYVRNQIIIKENRNGDTSVQGDPVEMEICNVGKKECALGYRTVEMHMQVEIDKTKPNKNKKKESRASTYVRMATLIKESSNGENTVKGEHKKPEHCKICTKGYVQQKFN